MMTWLNSILDGLKIYGSIAPTLAAILVIYALASKKLNIVSFFADQMAVAYMIVVLMLVFFPLPDAEKAASLVGYHGRFLPGSFIFDIAKEKSLESVLQVLFNIVMTIPFGMILTYRFGFTKKNVILVSFLFSLFIEVGQLTGLFFTYGGSYRLYDADDLICNTLGGFIGFVVMNKVQLPAIANFTVSLKKRVAAIQ
ncbi:MAG: VanZ family protein [Lachnospiraceae bacterium]|nr:VanZ family protein [Lachnospiraceae bacterium]